MHWTNTLYEEASAGLPGLGKPKAGSLTTSEGRPIDRDEAARSLVDRYTAISAAGGFAWGLPGYLALPLTLPANIASLLVLQLHMAQSLALHYGHDPGDPTIRQRCVDRVLGSPAAADEELAHRAIGKLGERGGRFLGESLLRLAGRGGRSLPLLGGAIGAVADAVSTADRGTALRAVFAPDASMPRRDSDSTDSGTRRRTRR